MDLSHAEELLIHVLRAGSLGDFGLTLARRHDVFVVTFASPEPDGFTMGAGPTLEAAIYSSIGREAPGSSDDGEPVTEPVKVLRLVGGTYAPVADDRRCDAVSAA